MDMGIKLFTSRVCNENEIYFSHSVQDGAISKWVLNSRGGFFDTYNGTLFVKEGYQLWFSDCQAICRNNCSCTACNTVFTNGTGCQLWREKFPRAQVGDANQEELYVLSSSKDKDVQPCDVEVSGGKTGIRKPGPRARMNPHELDNEALAFKPVLGSMLARIYHNPQNKEANQTRLQKILRFWASKEVYDHDTIYGLEGEMIGGPPSNSFSGPVKELSAVPVDLSAVPGSAILPPIKPTSHLSHSHFIHNIKNSGLKPDYLIVGYFKRHIFTNFFIS
ncbi:hypothetical protein AAG906_018669 [Vitis piasezkii]